MFTAIKELRILSLPGCSFQLVLSSPPRTADVSAHLRQWPKETSLIALPLQPICLNVKKLCYVCVRNNNNNNGFWTMQKTGTRAAIFVHCQASRTARMLLYLVGIY